MNSYERKCYERDGFIIIKGILPKDECRELVSQIKPLIRKERREVSKDKYGMCIMGKNRIGQPIIGKYRKWTAIYENPRLLKILDELHPRKKWKWAYGASKGLGWIHLRFPVARKSSVPKYGWHIDDSSNGKINPMKSITLLPILHDIKASGGGGTLLLRGSHRLISYWAHSIQKRISLDDYIMKVSKEYINNINNINNIIETTGREGDLLIMHPHLIHNVSRCRRHNKTRITFNLSLHYQ